MPDKTDKARPRAIDETTIAEVRKRIGIPVRHSTRAHNEAATADSFRHFAAGYGDDNPLYYDPTQARASAWRTPIAPPLYPFSAGVPRDVELTDAQRNVLKAGDPLAGIGQYMCGERWLLTRPIRAGDVLWQSQALHSAELRPSTFGGGSGALLSHRVEWGAEDGSPSAFRFMDFWHADREKSKQAAKNRGIERPSYSRADLARIDECYAGETIRGRVPRLLSDVEVGERLGPIAKGPLTVTDMVAWHSGVGWGGYGGGASRIAFKNRQRIPKFYGRNTFGSWDSAQRCHWDDDWARQMGHPAAYDYGIMRSNWMAQLVTNWMGDDAWIWKLSASIRKFNYIGDAHFVYGVVSSVDDTAATATIDAWGVNQRQETTCTARVVVILPVRGGEAASIPEYHPDQVPEPVPDDVGGDAPGPTATGPDR
jgi:acyl dehydratase